MPWVIRFLHDLDVGPGNLPNANTASHEHVDIEYVFALYICPSRNHKQCARKVPDAARAHMPFRTLSILQRIRIAKALAVERDPTEQSIVHRLLIQVGILCIVIRKVEFVLKEYNSAA